MNTSTLNKSTYALNIWIDDIKMHIILKDILKLLNQRFGLSANSPVSSKPAVFQYYRSVCIF
jgi:hypothetical protein